MKYFLAYPIDFSCNLHCAYCFHAEHHATNFSMKRRFTVEQYKKFRDTHLTNAEDIIVHFHGGETFIDTNINTICAFMRSTQKERIDLLTNGLQSLRNYKKILPFKDRIHRIGFTYHRRLISGVEHLTKLYEENVMFMHEQGIPVYVKELLFVEEREAIREYKRYWKGKGVEVKIQDYKGRDRGRSKEEYASYGALDYLLLDSEYKHGGDTCSCMKNYRNVLIRGGWMDGSILACFEDPKIIGRLQDNTFNPSYRIVKDFEKGRMDVQGVPAQYGGTYERDLYTPKPCGTN